MVNGWYHDAKDCYHNIVNQVRYACCHLHIHIHTHKIVRNVRWVHTYIQTINAWCMWCIWCIYVCCMCAMCKCFVIVFYMRAIQCKHANAWPGQIHSASPPNWLTIIACYLTLLLFCSLEVFFRPPFFFFLILLLHHLTSYKSAWMRVCRVWLTMCWCWCMCSWLVCTAILTRPDRC